ncbi:hypothetical protein EKPJFOCH_1341 [Methylobacterium thuringiense]|uniref:Uncharacterized protein n=1 Tax=Methylobacterium thuringiense TaxID=1003091 RepID=A0ABQ4THV8_9HYPH|nr:hypothetical protein EKPJFOCH_1341 [Methylobacterium thuringiense]
MSGRALPFEGLGVLAAPPATAPGGAAPTAVLGVLMGIGLVGGLSLALGATGVLRNIPSIDLDGIVASAVAGEGGQFLSQAVVGG